LDIQASSPPPSSIRLSLATKAVQGSPGERERRPGGGGGREGGEAGCE
jgi:hypothetical protein